MNIFEIAMQYLGEKKTGVIATVVARAGSAPRDVGAKMFVGEDGKLYGTIGGGNLEHNIYNEIMATMNDSFQPRLIPVRMDAKAVASDGMICGGNVDVFVEPVSARFSTLYERLAHTGKGKARGILATRFNENFFSKTLVQENGVITGDEPEQTNVELFNKHLHDTDYFIRDGLVIEPLHTASVLYLFGAGHVSQYIAKIARMVDFSVTVIDDRPEFANKERFPDADEVVVDAFEKVFDRLVFTGREFVVIVTRGHQHDANVLLEALQKQTRYTGMIGSKRKVEMIFEHMKKSGFNEDTIAKVYAPIGLSIHAETPQEIAVSIVSEMIKVRGE